MDSRNSLLAFCLLIGGYLAVYTFNQSIDGFTAAFVELRSEYTAVEQLSKFCLIFTMVSCIYAFGACECGYRAKAIASLLALAITVYLSESNMIRDKYQPIFGAILILPSAYWLLRSSQWSVLALFSAGVGVMGLGSLHDFLQESSRIQSVMPEFLATAILGFSEENMDTVGIGMLSLSAILLARTPISRFLGLNLPQFLIFILGVGLVAIGNGLAHYQYDPSIGLLSLSAGMSAFGLLVCIYILQRPSAQQYLIAVNPIGFFLAALFIFFVLPILWTEYNNSTAVLFWLMAIGISRKLYLNALVSRQINVQILNEKK